MTVTKDRGFAIGDADGVLECFEATAPRVFASLCHLTVGELGPAERLLENTYLYLQQVAPHMTHVDADWLVLTAHRLYLDDAADHPPLASAHPGDEWSRNHWGIALDAISAMSPMERAGVSLHVVQGFPMGEVARCLRMTDFDATPLVIHSRSTLQAALGDEVIADAFRHTELWLDDGVRAAVRTSIQDHDACEGKDAADVRKIRILKGVATVAAGMLTVLMIRWVAAAPNAADSDDQTFQLSSQVPTNAGAGAPAGGNSNGVVVTGQHEGGTYTMIMPVLGATGESLTYLAPDLSDFEEVVPDTIVRYANGKIGIAWTGACNRPASTVQLANLDEGIGLRLVTGAFPAVACTGMPDRWTTVIQPTIALDDKPIYPFAGPSSLDTSFTGYAKDGRSVVISSIGVNDADFGSALVDQANRPWIYGAGCSSKVYRYTSKKGPIFEVRLNLLEPGALTSGDEMVCQRLASKQVLFSPTGAQWPQTDVPAGAEPRDCNGPFKSLIDVPEERPFTTRFYDGDWSTWDGCLVSSRVVFSRRLPSECGWSEIRTVTFNQEIGQRIGPQARSLTYVRDVAGVLPGTRTPLLHYLVAPKDLYDTGLRFGTDELWLSTQSQDAIYMINGLDVERWPVLKRIPSCREP